MYQDMENTDQSDDFPSNHFKDQFPEKDLCEFWAREFDRCPRTNVPEATPERPGIVLQIQAVTRYRAL